MKKIYVASPLGFSEAGKEFLYGKLIPAIQRAGYEVVDPWKLTSQDLIGSVIRLPYGEERRSAWQRTNLIIGRNNQLGIDKSYGIVAVLDGSDVDSGTASEIGYAFGCSKKIIGYRSDFRAVGDNEGSIVNLQVEYFIAESGGKIVKTLEELEKELKNVFE